MRLLLILCLFVGTAHSSVGPDVPGTGLWSAWEDVAAPTCLGWTQAPPTEAFEAFCAFETQERRLWNACHTAFMALNKPHSHLDAERDLFEKLWGMGRLLRDVPSCDQDVVEAFYAQVRGFCAAQGITDEAFGRVLQDTRTRVKETRKYAYLRAFMGESRGMDVHARTADLMRLPEIAALDAAFLTVVDEYTHFGAQYPARAAFATYCRGSAPLHGKQLTKSFNEALEACAQTMGVETHVFEAEFTRYLSQQKEILQRANWTYVIQSFIRKQPFFFDFDLLKDARVSFWDGNGAWQKTVPEETYGHIFQCLAQKNYTSLKFDPRFAVRGGFVVSQQVELKEEPITDEEKAKICEVHMMNGRMVDLAAGPIPDGLYTWALNPDAVLRVVPLNTIHHSGLFQINHVGLPLACAGELDLKNGQITRLDNETGHYSCTMVQLALAVKALKGRDMLSPDCGVDVRAFGGFPVRRSVDDMVRLTDFVRLP